MTDSRDTLFDTLGDPGLFTFNDDVAGVFPDMIRRSVPGYSTVIAMTGILAARHARPHTRIYDLGCSLGASLMAAGKHVAPLPCELVGVDNSSAMITRCRAALDAAGLALPTTLIEGDICDVPIDNASVVIMNYTLQFVPLDARTALLRRIREAMNPGDALILSEKIELTEPAMNDLMIDHYHDFKRAQGYSDLEVAQKRQALENVLIPESREIHRERLAHAGFSHSDVWFQCFNFASLIAIA
ncbi:methyltransferase, putative [Luminiphilus syltensis NOR5-1B]|uniref:Carboxy-S-adenosyl-L-methionine synthase n=1 Tax=Luminiphilus syltensis NOR5-1B TaxID=565045 RepID=B8KRU7_9GAMM|nr:carboxy-S-adenosyl-L-methionine synthase CmoA [Luminiphilus syltensis]EED36599.1 methyltransferase, putative [Luminiphilus syltensis NOR5-1B]